MSTGPVPTGDDGSRRRRTSLQVRLIATVVGIVALILVASALATSTVLGSVLEQNLDASIKEETSRVQLLDPGFPTAPRDAASILSTNPQQPRGYLLLVQDAAGTASAAYVDDAYRVVALTTAQIDDLLAQTSAAQPAEASGPFLTVQIEDVGAYRVAGLFVRSSHVGLVGLPLSEVNDTIGSIFLTVGTVTVAGLVLLSAAIVVVIRAGLRPLRTVADTAERVATLQLSEGEVTITERVPAAEVDDRTEIGRVGLALNTLLDHVDDSLVTRQRNEERMRAFVADASHELRTPLASIRGYSELSLRALRLPGSAAATPEPVEASLERIQAQSLRMTALVEDLLLLARLDEGQELIYGQVDVTRVAVEAIGDARPAGPDHEWVLDIPDDTVLVAGDEARLQQVVANLLANARTHTPAGTTVTLSVARDDDDAVLRVHDDGPGIDPAIADEIFERFSRADRSRARQTGGTGLGLSIATAIVTAHRGSIHVTSSPGDTTFEVRLPATPRDPGA